MLFCWPSTGPFQVWLNFKMKGKNQQASWILTLFTLFRPRDFTLGNHSWECYLLKVQCVHELLQNKKKETFTLKKSTRCDQTQKHSQLPKQKKWNFQGNKTTTTSKIRSGQMFHRLLTLHINFYRLWRITAWIAGFACVCSWLIPKKLYAHQKSCDCPICSILT